MVFHHTKGTMCSSARLGTAALTACILLNRMIQPKRSHDLTPLDFLPWDHEKSAVYQNHENPSQELKKHLILKSPNLQEISFIGFGVQTSKDSMCLHEGHNLKLYYDLITFNIIIHSSLWCVTYGPSCI
jgi:hypothetical protein